MNQNFVFVKVHGNGIVEIHRKNSSIMLRAKEIQGVIQDLIYTRKVSTEAVNCGCDELRWT